MPKAIKDIFLINANYRILVEGWLERKDEIKTKIEEDFRKFTQGTAKDHVACDKLYYLDRLREKLDNRDLDDIREDFVKGRYQNWHDNYCEGNFEVCFDDGDFEEFIFEEAFKPLYRFESKHDLEINNLLVFIIKTVMEWEHE